MDKEKMAREGQTRIDIWLPDDLRQRAAQAAAADRRSLSGLVRLAVEAACTKAEEQHNNNHFEDKKCLTKKK